MIEMKRDSLSVNDIHKIREEHYEKTKNDTAKELIESINKETEEVEKVIRKKNGYIAIGK